WQYSTDDGETWNDIANSDVAAYDPDVVTETTLYRRLARELTCNPVFVVSDGMYTVTVNYTPEIYFCATEEVILYANSSCTQQSLYDVLATGSPAPTYTYVMTGATEGSGDGTSSGVTFNLGVTTVTVTATNSCGSDVCQFTVTVLDESDPDITCTGNQAVVADDGDCAYTHSGTSWDAEATDNCSVDVSYSLSGATIGTGSSLDGVAFNVGETTVTWTATDGSGNVAVCSFTVTVTDDQIPSFDGDGGYAQSGSINACAPADGEDAVELYFNEELALQGWSDNCSGELITTLVTGQVEDLGNCAWQVAFFYHVVDQHGNSNPGGVYVISGANEETLEIVGNDMIIDGCGFEGSIADAFENWANSFTTTGGCGENDVWYDAVSC